MAAVHAPTGQPHVSDCICGLGPWRARPAAEEAELDDPCVESAAADEPSSRDQTRQHANLQKYSAVCRHVAGQHVVQQSGWLRSLSAASWSEDRDRAMQLYGSQMHCMWALKSGRQLIVVGIRAQHAVWVKIVHGLMVGTPLIHAMTYLRQTHER